MAARFSDVTLVVVDAAGVEHELDAKVLRRDPTAIPMPVNLPTMFSFTIEVDDETQGNLERFWLEHVPPAGTA